MQTIIITEYEIVRNYQPSIIIYQEFLGVRVWDEREYEAPRKSKLLFKNIGMLCSTLTRNCAF